MANCLISYLKEFRPYSKERFSCGDQSVGNIDTALLAAFLCVYAFVTGSEKCTIE